MIASLIASFLLVVLYCGAAVWKARRLPESISAIVFDLSGRWRWTWGAWLWAVTFLVGIPTVDILAKEGAEGAAFAMMASLVFTGCIPLFDKDNRRAHYILAVCGGVMSQVCTLLICPQWLWMWLLMVVIPMADRMWWHQSVPVWMWRKGVLFAEAICYSTLTGADLTVCLR